MPARFCGSTFASLKKPPIVRLHLQTVQIVHVKPYESYRNRTEIVQLDGGGRVKTRQMKPRSERLQELLRTSASWNEAVRKLHEEETAEAEGRPVATV